MMRGHKLLPKLKDLETKPKLTRDLYLASQTNESIDPLWEGAAVILNQGADRHIQENYNNAHWYAVYQSIVDCGGVEGRIGIVTHLKDFHLSPLTNQINDPEDPFWIRVSCHVCPQNVLYSESRLETSVMESFVVDARLVTTIPLSFFNSAKQLMEEREKEKNRQLEEFFNPITNP